MPTVLQATGDENADFLKRKFRLLVKETRVGLSTLFSDEEFHFDIVQTKKKFLSTNSWRLRLALAIETCTSKSFSFSTPVRTPDVSHQHQCLQPHITPGIILEY